MGFFETFSNPSMLHAAVVHMPIVLALLGVPVVYYLAVTQKPSDALRWAAVGLYAATAVFAYIAVQSGKGAMDRIPPLAPREVFELLERHEAMGEWVWGFALATMVLLAATAIPVRLVRQVANGFAMLGSLMLGIWISVLGHFGGELVYKHSIGTPAMHQLYMAHADPATPPVPAPDAVSADGSSADDTPAAPPQTAVDAATAADGLMPAIRPINMDEAKAISFVRDVKPILDENCVECHNQDDLRGDFDVTSVEWMMEGGKKGGKGIVPGKPDEGSLVKYIRGELRPQMPKGEDPLTEGQLHVIRMWIAAGAVDDSATATTATPAPTPVDTPAAPEAAPAPAPVPDTPAETPAVDQAAPQPAATEPAPQTPAMPAVATNGPSVEELLFSGGPEDLLIKRRAYRLSFVPKPAAPPAVDGPCNNDVDRFIVAKWKVADPSFVGEVCDDATFARRVYLDIIGVIPKADDVKGFVADTAPDKREKLIDALLARDADYAAHWTPFWEDALCSNGNHQGGVGTRGNYRNWIFESFKNNKPYDLMTAELLDPHMPEHPARFVLRQDHTRILKSASDTAQVFLGTQMKCAACHNHFDNKEWSQRRFYGFAGYFSDADLELVKCEARTGEYVPTGFVFDMPGIPADVPKTEAERAARIAQLITDPCNPRFAKTIVNRLWKRLLGTGLFEPADDFRLDVPPSHPELLEWLAYDFMANGYDIKHTMRLILTSRTYQMKYDPALEDVYDVQQPGAPRYFRSPRLRRMTAEQLLDSVKVALGEPLPDEKREYRSDESTPLTRALGRPATRNEVSTARAEDTAVVQALELLNGEEFFARIYGGARVKAAAERAGSGGDVGAVVDELYWSVLNRGPSEQERAAGAEFLQIARIDPNAANLVDTTALDDGAADPSAAGAANWVSEPVVSGSAAIKLTVPTLETAPSPVSDPAASAPVPAVYAPASVSAVLLAAETDAGAPPAAQHDVDTPATSESAPAEAPAAEPAPQPAADASVLEHTAALTQAMTVSPDDILYVHVYIDPANPPTAIMLQWKEGEPWEHRAYWGDDALKSELGNGPQRLAMGALPEMGKWVRLEVAAHRVGLGTSTGSTVTGISFVQLGGTAYWDKAGALSSPLGGPTAAIGDALWALMTSPEFQYVR